MRPTKQLVVLAVVIVAIASVSGIAAAQAGEPVSYYGSAEYDNGDPVPEGTTIALAVDGVQQDTITVGENGVYAVNISEPTPKLRTNTSAGEDVTFHIGSAAGQSADETTTIDDSGVFEQNLTFEAGQQNLRTGIVEGGSTSVSFQGQKVESVDLEGLPGDVSQVEFEVTDENPASETPSNDVESYVDITPQDNSGGAVEVTNDVDVTVGASGSTINSLDDPVLIHNPDSSWTELSTQVDGNQLSATSSGLSPFGVAEQLDTGGGNGNGNGPGPGPGSEPSDGQEDGADDDAPPSVQEVQDTLNLIEPDADVSNEIADDNPDTPGLSVSPEGTQSVRNINFNNEDLTGTVSVREYNNPPEEVAQQVSESVADQVEGIAGDDGGADNIDVISVSDITVETEDTLADTSATVTKAVDRENVDNPDQLVVVKETFDEEAQTERWAQLETEVVETTDEEVVLEAEVESFSLFAVAEIEQPDNQQQVDDGAADGAADDGTEEPTDDGGPGPAVIIGVLVLLVVVGAAVYVFTQQGE